MLWMTLCRSDGEPRHSDPEGLKKFYNTLQPSFEEMFHIS